MGKNKAVSELTKKILPSELKNALPLNNVEGLIVTCLSIAPVDELIINKQVGSKLPEPNKIII